MFPPPGPGMPGAVAISSIPAGGGFGPAPRPGTGIIPADYIRVLAEWLRLPVTTTSSALVYFYRFDRYRKANSQSAHAHGLKTVDTLLFATACVYLATKTTDCNRKIRDVLNCAHSALRPDEPPMRIDTAHWKFRESLLAAELVLLRILKFELNVDLAYWPAIQYVRHLFRVHPAPPAPPVPPPAPPSTRGRSRSPSRPRDAGPRVRRSNRMSPPPPPPPSAARRRQRSRSRSRSRDRARVRERDRDRYGNARRSLSPQSRRGSRSGRERDRRRSSRSRSPAGGAARRRSRSRSPPLPPGGRRRSRSRTPPPPPGGRRRSRSPLPHPRVRRALSPPPPPLTWAPPPARFVVADMADQYQLPTIIDVPPAARFVLQTAWGFVADAYLRSSVLGWAAHDIALAAVAVALVLANAEQAPDVDQLCAAFRRPAGPVHEVVKWIVNTHELKPVRGSAGGSRRSASRRSLAAVVSANASGPSEEPVGMTSAPSS
ncbi:hypothetical protein AMAG_06679 [Allomyces macrogynus ATCC 38327]|uniref:Cyclin-like domain-containing protein n=1 Tax=Allomyces macrogynus (strain ATCC 38327) TaxID=578462 RepID=A0A0L0SEP1_ALLM3|nr:hypothetical protein AMAG_06679 [Allomyces macrogynus ATCC 38327]|eukprot:KNE60917.1 hypothetical protein AMAG_06679 [Allomyces macrogynus ATCC 38327]